MSLALRKPRAVYRAPHAKTLPRTEVGLCRLVAEESLDRAAAWRELPEADQEFLASLRAQDTEGYRVAIRALFGNVDARLRAGQFSETDALLNGVSVSRLHPVVALGFLTITLAAKDKLTHRAALGERVRELFLLRKSEAETKEDLKGLL